MTKDLSPLIPGGPEPTETIADWEAVLSEASRFLRSEPWKTDAQDVQKVVYVRSWVELAGDGKRRLCFQLDVPRAAAKDSSLIGFIHAAARPIFGEIKVESWLYP